MRLDAQPARVGYEWELRLCYTVEHRLTVVAGYEETDAIRLGDELALHGHEDTLADRMLVHSEAEPVREVFHDDPEAERIDWIDGPTAPSAETYWDDNRHFDEEGNFRR